MALRDLQSRLQGVRQSEAARWLRWQMIKARRRVRWEGRPPESNPSDDFDAHYQRPEPEFVLRGRYRLVERMLPPGASVLEVGCGTGGFLGHLQATGRRVFGVDYSLAAIHRATASGVPCAYFDLTSDAPLPTGYDVVVCLEVLEHFANPWPIYEKLWEAAGRQVTVTVPYRHHVPDPNHLFEFDYETLVVGLAKYGPVTFLGGHACYLIATQYKSPEG